MDFNRSLRQLRTAVWGLKKLSAVMLLALLAPSGCLLYSGRVDLQVCRLYLAGGVLLVCAVTSDLAARKVRSLWSYILICVLAAGATGLLSQVVGALWLERHMRTVLFLETAFGVLFLSFTSAQIRMREKRRRKAIQENDITWAEMPAVLEKPSVFGILFFVGAYILSLITNCPAFCDLSLRAGVLYTVLLLLHSYMQRILENFQEYTHLTHVPADKILRQHTGIMVFLVLMVCLASIPSLMTGKFRSYRDIRDWEIENVISPEDMLFPEMNSDLDEIVPHPDIEKGEYHPVPDWYKPAGYFLTGVVLLVFAFMILRAIRRFAFSFQGGVEENGDIAMSLAHDETAGIRQVLRFGRNEAAESDREKIRRKYRRTIRRYRRRGELPSGFETPSRIEEETHFPEDFDIASLHETYITARYGKNG